MTLPYCHEGGTDLHGAQFNGKAEEFVEWLWPIHVAMDTTQHTINNILIEPRRELNGLREASDK